MSKNILKTGLLLILFSSFFSLSSCRKCVKCHQFKVYEGAQVGSFEVLLRKEACGELECRKYRRLKNTGNDAGGNFRTFWECNLYPEDTIPVNK